MLQVRMISLDTCNTPFGERFADCSEDTCTLIFLAKYDLNIQKYKLFGID